ncbi:MAG: hypothetical protein RIC16_10380 [Rhodospirillales bacterium]
MNDVIHYLAIAWDVWCLPFSLVPYGDPYLATLAVFCLGCFAVKKFMNS